VEEALEIAVHYAQEKRPLDKIRDAFRKRDMWCLPMGEGDSKTRLPGFYRPLGVWGSCPKSCPLLRDGGRRCYAFSGYVVLHARRATLGVRDAVNAFVATSVVSLTVHDRPSRMFVSGDGCFEGKVDEHLFDRLCKAADMVAGALGRVGPVAYGYTRIPDSEALQRRLSEHHIELLRSGHPGPGGTVIWPITHMRELQERYPETEFAPCLHYTKRTPCSRCYRCVTARKLRRCVVLNPIGNHAKTIKQELLLGRSL